MDEDLGPQYPIRQNDSTAQHALFSWCIFPFSSPFPPPSCWLVSPSFCPLSYPLSLPASLPSFIPQTSVKCPGCVYTTKAQSKFCGNRFISQSSPRTGGPHPRNSNTQLASALTDFLRQNLKVPDSQISKYNHLFCLFHLL